MHYFNDLPFKKCIGLTLFAALMLGQEGAHDNGITIVTGDEDIANTTRWLHNTHRASVLSGDRLEHWNLIESGYQLQTRL